MFKPFTLNIDGTLCEFHRPQVMGIVNVTPDSFFSGSRTMGEDDISRRAEQMIADGVDIIDVGAYSSRPGANDVSTDEEIDRLSVGLRGIRRVSREIMVSVDTFRAKTAEVAVEQLGADMINDISGGDLDADMMATVARLGVPYILMHMRGTPATMQTLTEYGDVTADVIKDLSEKVRRFRLAGVADIIVDPGFGFSKTLQQNYEMMRRLPLFGQTLGCPVLVGVSRKSMVTKLLDIDPDDALCATTALNTVALAGGASIIRVHDVREAVQAVKIVEMSTFSQL